jgi:hypothetical protein
MRSHSTEGLRVPDIDFTLDDFNHDTSSDMPHDRNDGNTPEVLLMQPRRSSPSKSAQSDESTQTNALNPNNESHNVTSSNAINVVDSQALGTQSATSAMSTTQPRSPHEARSVATIGVVPTPESLLTQDDQILHATTTNGVDQPQGLGTTALVRAQPGGNCGQPATLPVSQFFTTTNCKGVPQLPSARAEPIVALVTKTPTTGIQRSQQHSDKSITPTPAAVQAPCPRERDNIDIVVQTKTMTNEEKDLFRPRFRWE